MRRCAHDPARATGRHLARLGLARLGLALLVTTAPACLRTADTELPPLPGPGGTVVLAFSTPKTSSERHYVVHDAAQPFVEPITKSPGLTVEAITYRCSPGTLGLTPGDLEPGTTLPWSSTAKLHRLEPAAGGAFAWVERPIDERDALLVRRSTCAEITLTTHDLPGTLDGSGRLAVVLDAERALVGADTIEPNAGNGFRTDPFWVVTRAGAERVPDTVLPRGTANRAGWRDPASGAVYAIGGDRRFQRIDLDRGLVEDLPSPPIPPECSIASAAMTGPSDPRAPFEVYLVTNGPGLYRFADGAWTDLAPDFRDCAPRNGEGAVYWVAPGEALAALPRMGDGYLHVKGGGPAVFEGLPRRNFSVTLRAFAEVEGWGLVAGGENGLYQRVGAGWDVVLTHAIDKITNLGALDRSILCACNEALVELHPTEDCGQDVLALGRHVQAILPIGRDLFVYAKAGTGEAPVTATFLAWKRPNVDACVPAE